MIVIMLSDCPPKVRGDISKWLCEINTGVFVGNVSSRVREEVWQRICENIKSGQATMVFSAPGEQKMDFRVHNTTWEPVDLDGLNYLAGKNLDFINKSAMKGTQLAHVDGGVPNLSVKVPAQNEYYLGQLFYFYEFACGVSGYILGVNPFNQPGVESYKRNMFALLGKPGYEAEREELLKRL